MLGVSWTESALHDADTIAEYFLAKGTPAERVEDFLGHLLSLSKRFAVLPGMGAFGKIRATREYRDAKSRCLLVYGVTRVNIHVLRIVHDEVGFADADTFAAMTHASISPTKKEFSLNLSNPIHL
ncbi:MAG: hypothetical protein DELT_02228 [Desulfovibrio sp.]